MGGERLESRYHAAIALTPVAAGTVLTRGGSTVAVITVTDANGRFDDVQPGFANATGRRFRLRSGRLERLGQLHPPRALDTGRIPPHGAGATRGAPTGAEMRRLARTLHS